MLDLRPKLDEGPLLVRPVDLDHDVPAQRAPKNYVKETLPLGIVGVRGGGGHFQLGVPAS
ncbi:hypothetical protein ACIBK9_01070 [Nonomuraea sp. NPDC050227]|uniref:hypothetical protein n=1 Tax=Nonomuraea sp. NPDC050227 TaxID=3364360 RepID=UPI0037A490EE